MQNAIQVKAVFYQPTMEGPVLVNLKLSPNELLIDNQEKIPLHSIQNIKVSPLQPEEITIFDKIIDPIPEIEKINFDYKNKQYNLIFEENPDLTSFFLNVYGGKIDFHEALKKRNKREMLTVWTIRIIIILIVILGFWAGFSK